MAMVGQWDKRLEEMAIGKPLRPLDLSSLPLFLLAWPTTPIFFSIVHLWALQRLANRRIQPAIVSRMPCRIAIHRPTRATTPGRRCSALTMRPRLPYSSIPPSSLLSSSRE